MNRVGYFFYAILISLNYLFAQDNFISNTSDSLLLETESQLVDGIFAIVGGHAIFHSDIYNQILQYQAQGLHNQDIHSLREQVIDELFFQKLLLHFASVDSVEIDNGEIENNLNQLSQFFQIYDLNLFQKYHG